MADIRGSDCIGREIAWDDTDYRPHHLKDAVAGWRQLQVGLNSCLLDFVILQ